jgi:hypothetical protein
MVVHRGLHAVAGSTLRAAVQSRLRSRCVSRTQLVVGRGPDALDALTGTDEKGCGRESDKGHQEGVLDQVLPGFVVAEAL